MEQLLRYEGRSSVVLTSTQGLQLQGSFVRTRMVLPARGLERGGQGEAAAAGEELVEEVEVALFMGSPRLESISELRVSDAQLVCQSMIVPQV